MHHFPSLFIQITVFSSRNVYSMYHVEKKCIFCLCGELFNVKSKCKLPVVYFMFALGFYC